MVDRKKAARYFHFLLITFVVLATSSCFGETSPDNLQVVKARFESLSGEMSEELQLEVANTASSRRKGLMYRRGLSEKSGMIFVFPGADQEIQMWMKNTYIPLDMIFVNSRMKVVGILRNIPILNLKPRGIEAKAKYLIEIAAGQSDSLGVELGDKLFLSEELIDALD